MKVTIPSAYDGIVSVRNNHCHPDSPMAPSSCKIAREIGPPSAVLIGIAVK